MVVYTAMGTRSDDGLAADEVPSVTYAAPLVLNVSKAGDDGDGDLFLYGQSIEAGDWESALVVCAENLPPEELIRSLTVSVGSDTCEQLRLRNALCVECTGLLGSSFEQ